MTLHDGSRRRHIRQRRDAPLTALIVGLILRD
jgi:hypothetical protein